MTASSQTGIEIPETVLRSQITEIPSLSALLSALSSSPSGTIHVAIFAPGASDPLFTVTAARGDAAIQIFEAAKSVGEGIIESRPANRN